MVISAIVGTILGLACPNKLPDFITTTLTDLSNVVVGGIYLVYVFES